MKFLQLSATITVTMISLIPGFNFRANAIEPDYPCFFTTQTGEVLDLSESVCHFRKSSTSDPQKDEAFIEAFKSQVMKYPDLRDNLLASVQRSPEENIKRAKSVCNDLKAGFSLDEIEEDQVDESLGRVGKIKVSIINKLATKYYCPDAAN